MDVKLGNNLTQDKLMAETLRGYLNAAKTVLEVHANRVVNIQHPSSTGAKVRLHPYLGETIQNCVRWEQKARKKEPYSYEMFEWLYSTVHSTGRFLSSQWTVFDWQRLGVFTGSRVSEYAQTKLPKGQRFNIIPFEPAAGDWQGWPIAFIRQDFTFYDVGEVMIPSREVYDAHLQGKVAYLEICFRYDKSKNNFTIRKYARTGHPFLDPVDAAVSIIHRADLLQVPDNEPIGVLAGTRYPYLFLRDKHVCEEMRNACVHAHPDPNHYLRQRLKCIAPHSNRVTAAVCLKLGGAQNDDIAFQLRWHPTSVPIYLRHCFKKVGEQLKVAICGALLGQV